MENIGVARVILAKFGTECRPMLTGLSVHNQRIERLWKDVLNYVLNHYRELFYFMEDTGNLDPLYEVHLLALKIVFIPRINKGLNDFTAYWNNHALRTESAQTPMQLWMHGVYTNLCSDTVIDHVNMATFDSSVYGVDSNVGLTHGGQTNNNVVVPTSPFNFTSIETAMLSQINAVQDDENFGITIYNDVIRMLESFETVQEYLI